MTFTLRVRQDVLSRVHFDLDRSHAHAAERVGFLTARAARSGPTSLIALAIDYHPVADEDYISSNAVGALIGARAFRKAMELALNGGQGDVSIFHLHRHEHFGRPTFSSIDLREARKFVPTFFHVAPLVPHGLLVLSRDKATGLWWNAKEASPIAIDSIVSVGAPLMQMAGAT